MNKQICLALFAVFAFSVVESYMVSPPNPCPKIFRYATYNTTNTETKIEGTINIPYDGSKVLNLAVTASMIGDSALLRDLKMKLTRLTSDELMIRNLVKNVEYLLEFPTQEYIPWITSIVYKNELLCSGPPPSLKYSIPEKPDEFIDFGSTPLVAYEMTNLSKRKQIQHRMADPED